MNWAAWPALILVFLIPLLHRYWRRCAKPPVLQFPRKVAKGAEVFDAGKVLLVLRYAALIFLIVALARPQTSFKMIRRSLNGTDIMMVMDVSASMNIEDLGDRSRFEIAKETMEKFIRGRSNDRIGFVIFSGEPLTLAPPTLDYPLVQQALKNARIGVLRDGTAIGDGLSLAIARLKDSKTKSRTIILLTDGDNNIGQVDPATAGDVAAGFGIRVYTIAIGREGRVKMPIRERGIFGDTVVRYQWFDNALNPELLQQIAKVTGGKFYRVTDEDALKKVFQEIDQLEKSDVKVPERVRTTERFALPLWIALALLALELFLSRFWWRVAI